MHSVPKFFLGLFVMSLSFQSYTMVRILRKKPVIKVIKRHLSDQVVSPSHANIVIPIEEAKRKLSLDVKDLLQAPIGKVIFRTKDKSGIRDLYYLAFPAGTYETAKKSEQRYYAVKKTYEMCCWSALIYLGMKTGWEPSTFFSIGLLYVPSLALTAKDKLLKAVDLTYESNPRFCELIKDPILGDKSLDWFKASTVDGPIEEKILDDRCNIIKAVEEHN